MRLKELIVNQRIVVQFVWDEKKIEFFADVLESRDEGVLTTPYIHNNEPVELHIEPQDDVICTVFADDTSDGKRVSWKNVSIDTMDSDYGKVYYISTSNYNRLAQGDDNRQDDRTLIHKNAQIFESETGKYVDIIVHDISDSGISFYAPASFKPVSGILTVLYSDSIDEKNFQMKLDCRIARTEKRAGSIFYGCKIIGNNKDYLTYSFLKRLKKRRVNTNQLSSPNAVMDLDQ